MRLWVVNTYKVEQHLACRKCLMSGLSLGATHFGEAKAIHAEHSVASQESGLMVPVLFITFPLLLIVMQSLI